MRIITLKKILNGIICRQKGEHRERLERQLRIKEAKMET